MNESVVRVAAWEGIAWLRHGFSTRRGGVSTVYFPSGAEDAGSGDLNLGWTAADEPDNVRENRRRLITAASGEFEPGTLVTVRQVHGVKSLVAGEEISHFFTADGRAELEADGLMTGTPGVLLGIQTADCVPVLVADTRLHVVAAFHAGWRGTVAGIVGKGVAQMEAEFGSRSEDLIAAVGPSIGSCCYNVGQEVRQAFREGYTYADELFTLRIDASSRAGYALYVDLWNANRRQLIVAGVPPEKITVVAECTGCTGLPGRRKYFSHRCEEGFTGRMMSVIGIVSDE